LPGIGNTVGYEGLGQNCSDGNLKECGRNADWDQPGAQARKSHQLSTAAAGPGMPTAACSVGRLVSMPVRAASLRIPARKAG